MLLHVLASAVQIREPGIWAEGVHFKKILTIRKISSIAGVDQLEFHWPPLGTGVKKKAWPEAKPANAQTSPSF